MDQQLLQEALVRLSRQLHTIKWLLGFFFVLFIAMLAILGFMTYKVITFTHDINNRINSFESKTTQSLDLKSQLCSSKTLTSLLDDKARLWDRVRPLRHRSRSQTRCAGR